EDGWARMSCRRPTSGPGPRPGSLGARGRSEMANRTRCSARRDLQGSTTTAAPTERRRASGTWRARSWPNELTPLSEPTLPHLPVSLPKVDALLTRLRFRPRGRAAEPCEFPLPGLCSFRPASTPGVDSDLACTEACAERSGVRAHRGGPVRVTLARSCARALRGSWRATLSHDAARNSPKFGRSRPRKRKRQTKIPLSVRFGRRWPERERKLPANGTLGATRSRGPGATVRLDRARPVPLDRARPVQIGR